MADSAREMGGAEHPVPGGARSSRPRTPVVLWVVMFAMVVMMVAWSVRKFGSRSSAEPGSPGAAAVEGKP